MCALFVCELLFGEVWNVSVVFLSFLLHINVGNIYIDMKLLMSADHSHARGHDLQLPFATLVGAGNYGEK